MSESNNNQAKNAFYALQLQFVVSMSTVLSGGAVVAAGQIMYAGGSYYFQKYIISRLATVTPPVQ
jgi:hypothetical protein